VRLLKQSSTAQPLVFVMVDSTDHITAKTGLSPTVVLSKNGGATASPAGAVTEVGSGIYKVAGNATDTATLGPLMLYATATGADPVHVEYGVVAFDPQVANLAANITQVNGNATRVTGFSEVLDNYVTNAVFPNTDADNTYLDATVSSRLAPTTAGRTLGVSATGECDADVVKVTTSTTRAAGLAEIIDGYVVGGVMPNTDAENTYLDATVSSRLAPTTAGRTLDIQATGEADVNVTLVGGSAASLISTADIDDVAEAVRDVDNSTPAAGSLGEAVADGAAAGGGDATASNQATMLKLLRARAR
jgi:hypothetical protein